MKRDKETGGWQERAQRWGNWIAGGSCQDRAGVLRLMVTSDSFPVSQPFPGADKSMNPRSAGSPAKCSCTQKVTANGTSEDTLAASQSLPGKTSFTDNSGDEAGHFLNCPVLNTPSGSGGGQACVLLSRPQPGIEVLHSELPGVLADGVGVQGRAPRARPSCLGTANSTQANTCSNC